MRTIVAISAVAAALVTAAPAFATGQPNASCESAGATPPPSAANGNAHAVSQYDIACFGGPRW
jgi:hypothetical protein